MRILLIGPCHPGGSIPPYLDVLAAALRRCGARVHRIGSAGVPYEPAARAFWPADRILEHASGLLRDTDIGAYDVISLHFGNLEIEQLLPVLWAGRRRAPVVCHVHSLEPALFRSHVPDAALRDAVDKATAAMDGYVFFGEHAVVWKRKTPAEFAIVLNGTPPPAPLVGCASNALSLTTSIARWW